MAAAHGDVVVVANKSLREARLERIEDGRPPQVIKIPAGSTVVLHISEPADVRIAPDLPGASPSAAANAAGGRSIKSNSPPPDRRRKEPNESSAYRLEPDSAYFVHETPGGNLAVRRIGLVNEPTGIQPLGGPDKPDAKVSLPAATAFRIPVKILVDDDERAARRVWEGRLRDRLQAASRLFKAQFGVEFDVVAVGTWQTDNASDDFESALGEFERAVAAEPAKLAIGFTSQYQIPQGRTHLGGTRVPLGTHILIREWSQHYSERERLEMLVHELAHYLGAAHSPESGSVMRPLLGDRQALAKSFQVGFDPLNTLTIALVAEQLPLADVRRLSDLPSPKIERLRAIYLTLAQAMPDDSAAPQLLSFIGGAVRAVESGQLARKAKQQSDSNVAASEPADSDVASSKPSKTKHSAAADSSTGDALGKLANRDSSDGNQSPALKRAAPADSREPFVAMTERVLAAVVLAARNRHSAADGPAAGPETAANSAAPPSVADAPLEDLLGRDSTRRTKSLEGDELTETYVRAAAAEALTLPAEWQVMAFFWGLAIALERREEMRRYPVLGDFIRKVESDRERRLRLQVLGHPTWDGREDLSQHFTFSAAIAVTAGKRAAEAAGMAKELRDARSGSGFSFMDWAADLAGIALADRVQEGTIPLDALAADFRTRDYLPNRSGLDEGLSWDEFTEQYGSTSGRRFRAVDADIRRSIERLLDGRDSARRQN